MNTLIAREDVTSSQRDEMYELLRSYFEGVTREQFERDLVEKNWVIEIRRNGSLMGFSTLLMREFESAGQSLMVVYSGDTIVSPQAWRSPELARAWIAAVNSLRGRFPDRRCYWLLLSSGFRTYRFLPLFWREFFPRHDAVMSPETRELLSVLANAQYGDRFDPVKGIVRFPQPQCLRGDLAVVPEGRDADPHIAYFLSRNPGHARGDELVCLTEINESNLTRAGRRMVGL